MNNEQIIALVDHTLLKAVSSWPEIKKLCEEALEYHTASVCIPPCFIKRVHESFPNLNICTVIGFPLGYNTSEVKLYETKKALEDGANEIDMVINLGLVKEGRFNEVTKEIALLKEACKDKILKVIVETCYLTKEEKIQVCKCVNDAKADYIKTSTGFGSAGATAEDVILFKENIDPSVKIKAAGGIKTLDDINNLVDAGASRLGSSSAIKLLTK